MSPSFNPNGWMADFWIGGSMALTLSVSIASFKIFLFSSKSSILSLSVVASLIVYYITFIILNVYETSDLYAILTM